jgi:undecaprenyl-diphosphatase
MMPLWFAALLGLVQGLTEFLPISSTAHLRIAPDLLAQPDPGAAFTAVIQLGTLAAVIVYFWKDLWSMTHAAFTAPRSPAARQAWLIVLGTVPIGIAGVTLKRYITGEWRALTVVAAALIAVGVLMAWVDRRKIGERMVSDLGVRDALLIGLAQACALVPGVSRSGATITCALLLGLTRPSAARWSFLLSIPAIAAAGVFELKDAFHDTHGAGVVPIAVATAVAFVSGYASIAWLLAHLRTKSLVPFAIYRVLLGGSLLAYVLVH